MNSKQVSTKSLVSLISCVKGVVAGMGAGIALMGAVSFLPMITISSAAIYGSSAVGATVVGALSLYTSIRSA